MRADSLGSNLPEQAVQGIDRILHNVETGRFERSLSALTAQARLLLPLRSSSSTTARASATR
jgi:NADPH-dependent curcumin reductase CurA